MPPDTNSYAAPSRFRRSPSQVIPAGTSPRLAETADFDDLRRLTRLLVAAAVVLPPSMVDHGPTLCLFRRATGIPCPNCGLARSWTATTHGRLRQGFRTHPLGPPALLAAVMLAVTPGAWLLRLRAFAPTAVPAIASVWLGTWVLRLVLGFLSNAGSNRKPLDQPSRVARQAAVGSVSGK